ncbi:hypothetical protein [Collimonas sp.]|jgi:hypothetical protein|uniref:hypothetical protein n=1 Tax=Collimonas sp. TaxID=1963772 RepID=UPI002C921D3A|nr:hypothetical protein [Collimonas sp.]HWX01157.1 hypothetical protein [Collimonas sp.]
MSAQFVLISRFPLAAQASESLRTLLKDTESCRYLFDFEKTELLQLRAFSDRLEFANSFATLQKDLEQFTEFMVADVQRELVEMVEAPKPVATLLPTNQYIQLRHVEVPPQKFGIYRAWREKTIFGVVRENAEVETFLAYHSVISTQPGVMFISGFSCEPAVYQAIFSSEKYKEIVRQAGDTYITGGTNGLYTRLYARFDL